MKLLLDTHTLLWFLAGDSQLSLTARQLIEEETNERFVSVVSLWEIAIKFSLGKLHLSAPYEVLFPAQLSANDIQVLPITLPHLQAVCALPFHHRDPFDRLLVAQVQTEFLTLLSTDTLLDGYDIQRVW